MEIIDTHSHFGIDAFWNYVGDVNVYLNNAKINGITETYAMSVPCPIIIKENKLIRLSENDYSSSIVKHYRVEICNDKKTFYENEKGINPYKEANDYLYNLTKNIDVIRFNYVPLIHPLYYSIEDMMDHIKRGATMFKIHSIASGITPNDISEEFLEILEALKIPIILHTDYSPNDNILSKNSPIKWLSILEKYDIKVFFAHAVRLSRDVIDVINADNRYIVGLAPDLLIMSNKSLEHIPSDYYRYCFREFNENKIVFDVDYPWNIIKEKNIFDWNFINRANLELLEDLKEKFYSKNIRLFLNKK